MRRSPGAAPALLAALLAVASGAPASEPPPEAVLADVPFEPGEANRVIVDLAPEGSNKPFPLFLDTGATASVLTPRMARELGVKVRRLKTDPYRRETRLGRDLQFWIDVASSDTASKTGSEYGLLGGEFLAEYVVEIDFPARRVRFLDRARYEVPESAAAPEEAVLPMRVVANRPLVEIQIEGRPLEVLLDTGAPDTAIVSGAAARKAGLATQPILRLEAGTVLGPTDLELVEVAELRLGPFGFGPGFPVLIAPRGLYNQASASDSVLGYDVLSKFRVRIDYRRRRLWLRRGAEAPVTLFGADYAKARASGVLLGRGEGGHVAYLIFPGSAAEWRGLRPGDVIDRVAGVEGTPDATAVTEAVAEGREIGMHRRLEDGWRLITLPAEERAPVPGAGDEAPD